MADNYKFAQGPARKATPAEIARETDPGYTAPDLHRRIDNELTAYTTEDAYLLTSDGDYLLGSESDDTPIEIENIETEDGDIIETEDGIAIQTEDSDTPPPAEEFYLLADSIAETSYPVTYSLTVQGVNSFRTSKTTIHTEESETSEIP